jgi:hypothetical protein
LFPTVALKISSLLLLHWNFSNRNVMWYTGTSSITCSNFSYKISCHYKFRPQYGHVHWQQYQTCVLQHTIMNNVCPLKVLIWLVPLCDNSKSIEIHCLITILMASDLEGGGVLCCFITKFWNTGRLLRTQVLFAWLLILKIHYNMHTPISHSIHIIKKFMSEVPAPFSPRWGLWITHK